MNTYIMTTPCSTGGHLDFGLSLVNRSTQKKAPRVCGHMFVIKLPTCGSSVRIRRICEAVPRGGHSASPAVFRSAPFARAARARPAARRPWRPSRPRRPACRESAQRRTRGFPSCTGLSGCTRLRRDRTSRKRAEASRAKSDKSGCPLSARSCPRRRAEAYRNSSLLFSSLFTF